MHHHRDNGVVTWLEFEARRFQPVAQIPSVLFEPVTQTGVGFQQVEHLDGRAYDRRCDTVRKEVGPRTLAQQLNDLGASADETAGGATKCLAECAGDDIDLAEYTPIFVGSAAARTQKAGGVAFIDAQ